MDQADRVAEDRLQHGKAILGRHQLDLFGFLDQRADPVDLLAFGEGAAEALDQLAEPFERQRDGLDRLAAGRLFGELGDVHVAEGGQHQRARDRRRRHHQHVGRIALGGDRQALVDAEAVLLVDDRQHQVVEDHRFLEQRVGADDDVDRAGCDAVEDVGALAALFAAGEDRGRQAGARGERRDGGEMLAREDFGRRHQGRLAAGLGGARHGEQPDHRLAGADIALQQAQHALGLGEIGMDLGQRLFLRAGQRIGECGTDLCLDRAVAGQRPPGQPARARAHQRQRDLPGQQFVIGEPPPGGAVDRDVDRIGRIVQPRQRIGEGRKGLAARHRFVLPFRQLRQPPQRLADGAAQHFRRQPGGQRVDRLDQRQALGGARPARCGRDGPSTGGR